LWHLNKLTMSPDVILYIWSEVDIFIFDLLTDKMFGRLFFCQSCLTLCLKFITLPVLALPNAICHCMLILNAKLFYQVGALNIKAESNLSLIWKYLGFKWYFFYKLNDLETLLKPFSGRTATLFSLLKCCIFPNFKSKNESKR